MEELDGCDVEYDPSKRTKNSDILALQLFADIDWTKRSEVARRKRELKELSNV